MLSKGTPARTRIARDSSWRRKAREWLWRYGPAEALAATGVVLVAGIVFRWSHNRVAAALAGTATELTVYYVVMWVRERDYPRHRRLKKLVIEFLPPGIVNTCFIRPYLLYAVPLYFSNFSIGILVGKFLADASFYSMTIPMYEISKRMAAATQRRQYCHRLRRLQRALTFPDEGTRSES